MKRLIVSMTVAVLGLALVSLAAGPQLGWRPADDWIARLERPERVAGLKIPEIISKAWPQAGSRGRGYRRRRGRVFMAARPGCRTRQGVRGRSRSAVHRSSAAAHRPQQQLTNVQPGARASSRIRLIPEKVDLAFFHDVLHHVDKRPAYLQKVASYLKPSGRIAVIELDATRPDASHRDQQELQVTREELDNWMKAAGLRKLEEIPMFERQVVRDLREDGGQIGDGLVHCACRWSGSRPRSSRSVAAAARRRGGPTNGAAALPVNVLQVNLVELRRDVEAVGTLAAHDEAIVSAEVEARVARLAADMGDRVAKGAAAGHPGRREAAVPSRRTARGPEPDAGAARRAGRRTADAGADAGGRSARSPDARKQNRRSPGLGSSPPGICCRPRTSNAPKPSSRRPRRPTMPRSPRRGTCWPKSARAGGAQGRQPRAPGHRHPRTVRRRRRRATRLGRPVRPRADSGDADRPSASAASDGADPRAVRAGYSRRSNHRRPRRCLPRSCWSRDASPASVPDVDQRSRAFAIEAAVPNLDGALKPGTFARVRRRHRPGRQDRRRAGHRRADPLRPDASCSSSAMERWRPPK